MVLLFFCLKTIIGHFVGFRIKSTHLILIYTPKYDLASTDTSNIITWHSYPHTSYYMHTEHFSVPVIHFRIVTHCLSCCFILQRGNFFLYLSHLDIIPPRNLLWPTNSELGALLVCSHYKIYSFITTQMKWHYS